MKNPVSYFEIPVTDLDRAIKFYELIFDCKLERTIIDGIDMALFPFDEGEEGISGALAQGESYEPSIQGSRLYFKTLDIDETLRRVLSGGGSILYPKTSLGEVGWVAEFLDIEGNRIALHAPLPQITGAVSSSGTK